MPDEFENGINPDPDDLASEFKSIEAAEENERRAKTRTKVIVEVTFDRDWGGTGNILSLLSHIRNLVGVEDVELGKVKNQEELL